MRAALLLLVTLTACDDGRARTDLEDPGDDSVVVVAPDDTDALTGACRHLRNPECLPEEEAFDWDGPVCDTFDATDYCWRGAGCIPVVYQADHADYLPAIQRALDTWEAFPCSDVCFEAPRPVHALADAGRGVITFGPHRGPPPAEAHLQARPVVNFGFDTSDDSVFGATVAWDRARFPADDPCAEPMMVRAVALALGVEDGGVPSPSLLGIDVDQLTTHDQAAFCGKYGEGGRCGR